MDESRVSVEAFAVFTQNQLLTGNVRTFVGGMNHIASSIGDTIKSFVIPPTIIGSIPTTRQLKLTWDWGQP